MNTTTTDELEQDVETKRNQLKSEKLDMSFSELMSMYQDEDLIISPEYQRSFRWNKEQQTRFIESVLLGIPTPPIFVAEDDKGRWELVDGLQRISTIFAFFGLLKQEDGKIKDKTSLEAGSLISKLEGKTVEDISIKLKNTIKRAFCRVEILRWDSNLDMRYELFNRLNTGGSPLSSQEVRNCVYRGEFNELLHDIAKKEEFQTIVQITEEKEKSMYGEELVLRFFALQKQGINISKKIDTYLTAFMEKIYKKEIEFQLEEEKSKFVQIMDFLKDIEQPFKTKAGFSLGYWDVFLYFLSKEFDYYKKNKDEFQSKMEEFKQEYRNKEKHKTNASMRVKERIELAESIFTPKK